MMSDRGHYAISAAPVAEIVAALGASVSAGWWLFEVIGASS